MLRFVDASNNNAHVDFAAVKKAGAVGVYLKVTEGTSFVDSTYAAKRAAAKAAGLRVGGYHFAHPQNNSLQELGFFLSHLILEPGDLLPALDLEVTDGQTAARVHQFGLSFLHGLRLKIDAAPVLYSGESFMRANGLLDAPGLKWVADYGAHPVLHFDAWQYTDGQAKYGAPIDGLDTSLMVSLAPFIYKAPVSKKVAGKVKQKAVRAKFRVIDGFMVRRGSKLAAWLKRNAKRLRGKA